MIPTKIHETAIVDEGATLGEGCRVWHWVHICSGAVIGNNCSFGQNVFIGNEVKIGNNVKIQNNVSVYDKITIGNDVFCGPSMVFTNVRNPRATISRKDEYLTTIVEDGVTFGANSTIICGVTIGRNAFIAAGSVITKNVKNFALMAGNPGVQIGWMSLFGQQLDLPLTGNAEATCRHTGQKYQLRDGILFAVS